MRGLHTISPHSFLILSASAGEPKWTSIPLTTVVEFQLAFPRTMTDVHARRLSIDEGA